MIAWPGGHGPAARAAGASCGPAARWIAPSTPPPPDRPPFAALAMASRSSVVMSATTTSRERLTPVQRAGGQPERAFPSVVEDEGHHEVDLPLDDLAVADVDPLLLDPRAADVAERLGRPGDA